MVRTQIQLEEEQMVALRRLAAERGVSIALIVREAVDRHLLRGDDVIRREQAIRKIGGYRSQHGDVGREHDRYLAEDFDS